MSNDFNLHGHSKAFLPAPRRIDALPEKFAKLAKNIQQQLGWKVSVTAGGPRPDTGEFVSYS